MCVSKLREEWFAVVEYIVFEVMKCRTLVEIVLFSCGVRMRLLRCAFRSCVKSGSLWWNMLFSNISILLCVFEYY